MTLQAMLLQNPLGRVGGVLEKCLNFHQEVEVNSASKDWVYDENIQLHMRNELINDIVIHNFENATVV